MTTTAASVIAKLEGELAALGDSRVVDHIRSFLVTPKLQMRPWDYGRPGEAFPCWLVLEHQASNTGIAYYEQGFGPGCPWGLLCLEGTEHMSMGMDSGWFEYFLEAYFESKASSEVPIWRVFKYRVSDFPGSAITDEGTWDDTWAEVMWYRGLHDEFRYDCSQSIYRRDA